MCLFICVCVFIKLHVTAQSAGPDLQLNSSHSLPLALLLLILPSKGGSTMLITKTSDQTRREQYVLCVVCVFINWT